MGVSSRGEGELGSQGDQEESPPAQPYPADSGTESTPSSLDRTLAHVREHAFSRLQQELKKAHEELKLRDEEVSRLSRIRKEVEAELEELTASLFQEAHSMVREANMRRARSERLLKESAMQVEVLTAEVAALKTLVLTSTPSMPNPHLHPQIGAISKKHKRSPSHNNLKYGRVDSASDQDDKPAGQVKEAEPEQPDVLQHDVDPVLYKEFLSWKECPIIEKTDPFISRIFQEDIDNCLNFSNMILSAEVKNAVETGDIFIESVCEKSKLNFPKKCALQDVIKQCQYRLKVGNCDNWHYISLICRNRIIAVCDFLNYLRYIKRGLVKSSDQDIYWEIIRLRKEIMLARLGLNISN